MRALDFALALNDIDQSLLQESLDRIYRVKRTASRRRLLKIALLAALLSALFIAAAYASGFFPLRSRIHSDEDLGRLIVPNGSQASAEYQAAVDWFGYLGQRQPFVSDFSFADTEEERGICQIYFVPNREALDVLLDISREYGLSLYTDSIFVSSPEQLYVLAGTGNFSDWEIVNSGGYVFSDGSFKLEGLIDIEGTWLTFTLHRIYRGSIYPYNGYGQPRDYAQEEYLTARGFDVGITAWEDGRRDISFSDGEVYINLSLDGADEALARRAADGIDFAALCTNNGKAGEILRRYEYDAGRHRVKEEYLEDGELLITIVYEYSGELLVRMEQSFSTGGMVYETYGYDELGRLIEQNSYYPNAIGGPISSSGAFWYDDQGYRHAYAKDENGNLVGYEDQPIRKPQD